MSDRPRELTAGALIARRIGRALAASILPVLVSEIPCPRCGRIAVVLMHGTRRLYRPSG